MLIHYEDGCFHVTLHSDFKGGVETWYAQCRDHMILLDGYDCYMLSSQYGHIKSIISRTISLNPPNIYNGNNEAKSALYNVDSAHNYITAIYYIEDICTALRIDFETGNITRKVLG